MKTNQYKLGFLLIKRNYKSILLFEILYKIVMTALFTPMLIGCLNLAMYLANMRYISNENVWTFLAKPSTLFILVMVFLLFSVFTTIELAAVVTCYHASYHNEKIRVADMFEAGFRSSFRIFKPKNMLLFIYTLCMIPITNITIVSGYMSAITIPNFIVEHIKSDWFLMATVIIVLVVMGIVMIRWLFSVQFFINEKILFCEARKRSLKINHGHYISNILHIIVWSILIAILASLFAVLCIVGIAFVIKVFTTSKVALSLTLAITATVIALILVLFANFTIPITYSIIGAMYYRNKILCGEDVPEYQPITTKHPKFRRIASIVLACASVVNVVYIDMISDRNFSFRVQFLDKPQVTAHRGDSISAPENTIPAFESAIEKRADYAELDVQQTKDGVIVVMHDSNLKRTTGVNKNIWEVTYDEIKDLDAGSWFSPRFEGMRIPTLDEVLKICDGDINLNIELKPTGHEVDFEKCVLDIIYDNGYEKDCVIASMDYSCLEKVKEYDPDITTVFVTAVAYGSMTSLEHADAFSIEASFVTNQMVSKLHDSGKQVYAWTVNTEDSIQKMIEVGVDNIITDNPVLAHELVYSKSLNENIVGFINDLLSK